MVDTTLSDFRVARSKSSLKVSSDKSRCLGVMQFRVGTSGIDTWETYHSGTMDAANRRTSASRDREVGRNLDEESFDADPSSMRRGTDGIKEDDDAKEEDEIGSKTDEDARQLALRETETDRLERKSTKISDDSRVGKGNKKKICVPSERNEENEEKRDWEQSVLQRKWIDSRKRCGGKRDKSANTWRESKPLTATRQSPSDLSDSEDECAVENKMNCRERAGGHKEIVENTYDELKYNCCHVSRTAKDPELERNDTRKFVGEVIDNSLSRETERGSAGALRETKKARTVVYILTRIDTYVLFDNGYRAIRNYFRAHSFYDEKCIEKNSRPFEVDGNFLNYFYSVLRISRKYFRIYFASS